MNEHDDTISIDHPEHNPLCKNYDQLRAELALHRNAKPRTQSLITFNGIPGGKDAYNPSGPFVCGGDVYQWVRVESRTAQDAVAMLFKRIDDVTYELVPKAIVLPFEDPFTAWIGDTLLVGGVEITKDEHERVIAYRTVFYKGTTTHDLHPFAMGPDGMKDIRFAPIRSNSGETSIVVFTRPHIPVQSRMVGRIAMTEITSIEELAAERLAVGFTEIIPDLFANNEWGGVNDAQEFSNGLIGVLCHVSKFDEAGKRHYAAAVFVIDPDSKRCSPLTMIAERSDFPIGPIKIMPEYLDRPEMYDDLADVIFSSRLTAAQTGGTLQSSPELMLTCGLSDAAVGTVRIENPFPEIVRIYFPERVI